MLGVDTESADMDFLKAAHCQSSGQSVYDQLTGALAEALELNPKQPASLLETTLLRTPVLAAARSAPCAPAKDNAEDAAQTNASLALFGDPVPAVNEEGEAEELAEPDEYAFFEPERPDLALAHLARVGEGLAPSEASEVLLAMKRLGGDAEKKVEALRFWGKVLTLRGAYLIFECRMAERPEKEEAADAGELPPGEAPAEVEAGTNKYMYFVTSSCGAPFTLLDDVTPAQVRAARGITKLFTGDLDAPVAAYPPFLGQERHYLRAQNARIGHATTLCPKGLYIAPEEGEGEPEANEEYAAQPVAAMHDPANWSHWQPHVKAMGVTVLPEVPEPEDEENPPVLLPEQTEKGPAALEAADQDADVLGMHSWAPVYSSSSRTVMHQVAGVRSIAWPGAVAITDGNIWANAYVGWGVKRGAPAQLPAPPAMASEVMPPQECDDLPDPRQKEAEEEAEDE